MEENKDKLKYPVTVSGREFGELTMRRPKVKDDLAAQAGAKTEAEREVILFAALCGVPADVIRELDQATDYKRLQADYEDFFA